MSTRYGYWTASRVGVICTVIVTGIVLLAAPPGNISRAQVTECVQFSPRLPSGEIALESDQGDLTVNGPKSPEIAIISTDGSQKRRLTTSVTGKRVVRDTQPAWSPDGKEIAFVSDRSGSSDIYLMEADGTQQRPLIATGAAEIGPAWSPDSRYVAFVSDREGQREVYLLKFTSTAGTQQPELKRLTMDGGSDPAWSPDSKQIAYRREGEDAIYITDIDGFNVRRLTEEGARYGYPAWSPDGKQIAVTALSASGIYVISVKGSGQQRLTTYANGPSAWSPDGRYLAYAVNGSDFVPNINIYVVDTTNRASCRLTKRGGWNAHPAWSPASR